MDVVHQYVCRLAERMLGIVIAAAFTLVLLAAWLFVNDRVALQSERRLRDARAAVEGRIDLLQGRIEQLAVDVAAQQQQVMSAEKSMRELRQLKSTWDWFAVNREQQRANRARLDQMEDTHAQALARLHETQQQLRRARWERDGHEIERDRLDEQLRAEAERKLSEFYLLERAWLRSRSWLLLGVAGYLLGPVLVPVALHRRRPHRPVGA